jgi:hypothetical protein
VAERGGERRGPIRKQSDSRPFRLLARHARRHCSLVPVIRRVCEGVVERSAHRQHLHIGRNEPYRRKAVRERVFLGELRPSLVSLYPDSSQRPGACREAQQGGTRACPAFKHPLSGFCRNGGCKKHGLDAAPEAVSGLSVRNSTVQQ